MIEKNIIIDSYGNRLSGTVCLPQENGCFPFVLMIHGSGPLDRDENMEGQQLNVFNTIAHHLAREGIATLRYDKRGCGKSSGDYYATGHSDLVMEEALPKFWSFNRFGDADKNHMASLAGLKFSTRWLATVLVKCSMVLL